MNSRGQGMSVNVIIIAAIALIVMVILIALVLRAGGDLTRGQYCSAQGEGVQGQDYKCVAPDQSCGDGFIRSSQNPCEGSTEDFPLKCCIALG